MSENRKIDLHSKWALAQKAKPNLIYAYDKSKPSQFRKKVKEEEGEREREQNSIASEKRTQKYTASLP